MATLYKCDRCSEVFDKKEKVTSIRYPNPVTSYIKSDMEDVETTTKDICYNCVYAIAEFINTSPAKESKK